jgi:hypothetical protein
MKAQVVKLLSSPRAPAALALLALLLGLPSLTLAPVLDDHGFRFRLSVQQRGPSAAFHLLDPAAPTPTGARMWWASPPSEVRFFRPLAALSHFLDYRVWPGAVWWMRLESCLLYAWLVWLAATCYRRLASVEAISGDGPATWGVAALMFAVNEANAHSLSMIASRNTLLYAAFGLLALLCHHVYRDSPRAWQRSLGPLAFALSLLSGEGGVATLGYLVAYTACVDDRARALRMRSVLPYAALVALWGSAYIALDYGSGGGALFRDPSGDPLGTLIAGLADLPVWIASQLSFGFATAGLAAPPAVVRLTALPIAVVLLLVLWPTLRERRLARFLALGSLLSLAPLMATWPQDRLLVMASFGAFGLLACFFDHAARSAARSQRVARRVLVAIHLVIAPLAFIPSYLAVASVTRAENKVDAALGSDPSPSEVIVVRAPTVGTLGYTLTRRLSERRPVPRRSYELYAAGSTASVTRVDAQTLELAPAAGYCSSRPECIVTDSSVPFRVGQRIDLPGMQVEIRELTQRDTPARVRFRFSSALEDPARRWLVWTARGIEPFSPPAIGTTTQLPKLSALTAFR